MNSVGSRRNEPNKFETTGSYEANDDRTSTSPKFLANLGICIEVVSYDKSMRDSFVDVFRTKHTSR